MTTTNVVPMRDASPPTALQSDRRCELLWRSWAGLKIETQSRTGQDGQVEVGATQVTIGPEVDLAALRREVEEACLPASREQIVMALTKLALITAHSDKWDKFKLSVYAEVLVEYPGDAVLETLRGWIRRGEKWMPTVPELIDSIRIKARKRLAVREAVERETERRVLREMS